MIGPDAPILLVGAGSIGERYISLLQSMGYRHLFVYRQRGRPLRTISESDITTLSDWGAIDSIAPHAAIICSPTSLHTEQSILCLERKIPVLVEKPLSHGLDEMDRLASAIRNHPNTYFQVAYMLRYHPFFKKIQTIIANETLGPLLTIQTHWGEYLPDWHPWEDYRTSYAARKELGGGAALTLSHDIDLCNWLANSPVKQWNTLKNVRSGLEINVEAGADLLIAYDNGLTAHCHLNFFERIPSRWYHFVFEEGTVRVDYTKTLLSILRPNGERTFESIPDFDRNMLYQAQLTDFFQKINTPDSAHASLNNLINAQKIVEICT